MNNAVIDQSIEDQRIEVLKRYAILDTPQDGAFDNITSLASTFLKVPIAIVSLVDKDRIWFKSHHGIKAPEINRSPGLCSSAILFNKPYVVENAAVDPRTLANPLIAGELGFRFYAAAQLRTHDGFNLGTLCIIDYKPRTISDEDINALEKLAQLVMDQMELRLAARKIDELNNNLKNTQEELRKKATHDALTGVWNRGAILELIEKSFHLAHREAKPMTILQFDIDNFKSVNDSYGHAVGDEVLQEVSKRISKRCRNSEAFGRMGGEEFVAVLYPCGKKRAQLVGDHFRKAVCDKPIRITHDTVHELQITTSVGTFSTDESDTEIDIASILKYADQRLYIAKEKGRNCVVSITD
jgi:diguanylate cyclase (GGDEF)-like protein